MEENSDIINNELDFEELRKGILSGIALAHNNAVAKGFWDNADDSLIAKSGRLMLMVSELGEACEAQRKGIEHSEHIPEFTGEEEELADVIIRILDYAGRYKLRLANALITKMQYNATRPYRHGKNF